MSEQTFFRPRWLLAATLILLLGLGLAIRLYNLTNLPLDFHPTRQLLSALKARGMYLQSVGGVPDWQRSMAIQQWHTKSEVEPEVFERLVAWTYHFTGEQLWVSRIYSSIFWLIGGVFLFLLVRELISVDGAVAATAYYLFFPYAVIASRSFQPDPMMVMLMICFWWAFARWTKSQSWAWAIAAGLVGGFAIYIKFVSAFFVMGGALGLLLGTFPLREAVRKVQLWLIAALGVLPGAAYIFYGVVLHGFLGRQFGGRFIPSLLLSPVNYLQWALMAERAAGVLAITLGLLGLLIVQDRRTRSFLLGLWAAYVLFGLFFDYHVATHDYYHLPLIPLVGISLAPVAAWCFSRLAEVSRDRWMRLAAFLVLLFGLVTAVWNTRNDMKSVDYRPQAAMWAQIGDLLGHRHNVAALTQDYGSRLAYWGWQDALIWPNSGDIDYHAVRGGPINLAERFQALTRGSKYFLVTDFTELDRQPDLKQRLAGYAVYAQGDGYVIYDLQRPAG
ncbi:MAG TPA: glycosyltransferase family 39 protein [Anaerolineales bacterium]